MDHLPRSKARAGLSVAGSGSGAVTDSQFARNAIWQTWRCRQTRSDTPGRSVVVHAFQVAEALHWPIGCPAAAGRTTDTAPSEECAARPTARRASASHSRCTAQDLADCQPQLAPSTPRPRPSRPRQSAGVVKLATVLRLHDTDAVSEDWLSCSKANMSALSVNVRPLHGACDDSDTLHSVRHGWPRRHAVSEPYWREESLLCWPAQQ